MSELLTIERREARSHDYGGAVLSWVKVADARAFVRGHRGDLAVQDGEIYASEIKVFEVHWHVGNIVRHHDRIAYKGDIYRVVSIEPHRVGRKCIITAERNNE